MVQYILFCFGNTISKFFLFFLKISNNCDLDIFGLYCIVSFTKNLTENILILMYLSSINLVGIFLFH